MNRKQQKYIDSENSIAEYLRYEPSSGKIFWIKIPPHSRVKIGAEAGAKGTNHILLHLRGVMLYAHVVAWWLETGKWPEDEVDHKNLDGYDNRWQNLRLSTRAENAYNRRSFSKTGRGLRGAFTQAEMNGRWFSLIVVNKKRIYLGRFATEEEAHAAYVNAAHKYHGEFARTE